MNKRVGAESIHGVGGGTVSAESMRNLRIAEDLCRKGKPEKAVPFLSKALEDPNNLDAAVQLAFLAPNLDASVEVLEDAEKAGRTLLQRTLGPTCFKDGSEFAERFWGILETRPYMRVLQALVRLSFENKDYTKSARTIIEMLRLCPGDNLSQRDWLGSVLLKAGRPADALFFVQEWLKSENMDGSIPPRGGCAFAAPSKEPMSAERVERLNKHCKSEFVYTGALAAFTLWGDCELARQYLAIGAKVNSHVLARILAKVDQPRSLNMDARTMNGPETAHDYLWMTQDLWMVPAVWAWADARAQASGTLLRACAGCGRVEARISEFKRCAGCKRVVYCGAACQREDWKAHKPKCQEQKRIKEIMHAMGRGKPPPPSQDGRGPLAASADFSEAGTTTRFYPPE